MPVSLTPAVCGTCSASATGARRGTFRDVLPDGSSTVLGSSQLDGATASLTLTSLAVGTHTIHASYSGDANYYESRSEERRVGKECRSRWAMYHSEKNVST